MPNKEFIEALNDYCQDYYKHYDGYPVEFEYKDKVYPYEYYVDYIYPSVRDYPVENGETQWNQLNTNYTHTRLEVYSLSQ